MKNEGREAMQYWRLYASGQHLSEESLREIGQGLSSKFSTPQDASAESVMLEGALKSILHTACSTQISQSHRAAACNALTALLEKCRSSPVTSLRSLSRPDYLWSDIFSFYLEKSDKAKAKPMRQVLVTLSSIILGYSDYPNTRRVLDTAVTRVIAITFKQEAYSRVKPALQALDYFIGKRAIPPKDLLELVHTWQINSGARAVDSFSGTRDTTPIREAPETTAPPDNVERARDYNAAELASAILQWMPEPDIAPAAGDLFVTLFSTLKKQADDEAPRRISNTAVPAWCSTLEASIERSPEALENIKQHIFPGLFKLSAADFNYFLECLRVKDILSGSILEDEDPRVMTLFTALQVGKEIGLVTEEQALESVDEGPFDRNVTRSNSVVIPDALIGKFLARASATIRLAALSLLIASPLLTRPFSSGVLSLLEQNMAFFHADTDAKFRTDVLNTTKRLIDRLRGSISSLSRDVGRYKKAKAHAIESEKQWGVAKAAKSSAGRLQRHVEFLNWYISFLIAELQPTASYQRHVTALKALNILLQSGLDAEVPAMRLSKLARGEVKWPFHVKVLDTQACRVLLDLLADPFDDVRNGAASILKMATPDSVYLFKSAVCVDISPRGPQKVSELRNETVQKPARSTTLLDVFGFLSRIERKLHLSGRADHADGVARTYEIIFDMCSRCRVTDTPFGPFTRGHHRNPQLSIANRLMSILEEGLDAARMDLALAVSNNPVHGHIAGVRLILDQPDFYNTLLSSNGDDIHSWKQLHERIIRFCQDIWECIKGSLCNDSPEGHIPEEFDDEGDLGTKDILSYSWRALKESSAVLRTIISKATHDPQSELSIIHERDIRAIGQLSFKQLAELRHRGAFSTVSLTFAACCQRCLKEKSMSPLLSVWYKNTWDCIRDQASTTTRRSAGIPSLITGVMTSDPGGPLFVQVILDLLAEARQPIVASSGGQEVKLPQVHALNCLKDAFANSRLGPCSEPYLAETMELSVKCLGSDVWAIRNCGIMLFRALADRLFGTNEPRNKWHVKVDKKVTKLLYDKYPNLPGLLKKLLGQPIACGSPTGLEDQDANLVLGFGSPEAVFPAMDIIRRAGSPKANDTELRELILFYMGSKIWHVRDMAARTFCSLVDGSEFIGEVSYLANLPWISNNALHGQLLGIRYLLQAYLPQDPNQLKDAIQLLVPLFQDSCSAISRADICPVTKSVFFEAANIILESYVRVCYVDITTDCPLGRSVNQLCEDMEYSQSLNGLLALEKTPGMQRSRGASGSLYKRALVRGTILHHCLQGQIGGLQPVIEALTKYDPGTLRDIVDLFENLYHVGSSSASAGAFLEIGIVLFRALEVSSSSEAKAYAASYVAGLCERSPLPELRLLTDSQKDIVDILPVASYRLADAPRFFSSPSLMNAELRLWGSIATAQCTQQSIWPESLIVKLGEWTVALYEAGDERNDFSTRMAAVASLNAFKRAFRMPGQNPRTDDALLGAYIALYDILNDDDGEIRDIGAAVVSWVLSSSSDTSPRISLLPLAASLQFSEWLSSQYSHSIDLFTTAVQRLTLHSRWLSLGMTEGNAETLESVESLLAEATKEDRSLFIEEKQNLFIDEVREAEVWSRVLLRMAHEASHEQLAEAYIAWVREGLIALSRKARIEALDGPLGWTAKPEVFALGIHVILGAKVVLEWMRGDDLDGVEVTMALKSLAEVGRQTSLHELWLSRIDLVIAQRS
ncbi:hypothetical protein FGG08_001004 [Glutinoglossum americanum]|uniref:DUF2428 domain-containing protein n=1 Tax=Glutinoglossum americanum TaxID=1670608 RepID=A0A9P8I7U6_9PEZI|nr:hypothetical protein FGG08_001004 [Glutinoglossum americanum]